MKKYFLLLLIFIIPYLSFCGEPIKKKWTPEKNEGNIFEDAWPIAFSTDLTFYNGRDNVSSFGLIFEPSVTEWLSLNYKFSLNFHKGNLFTIHGTPGTVVSPYFISEAIVADTATRGGYVLLSILSLLIPEGVNFKFIPQKYDNFAFSIYVNPLGIEYASREEGLPSTIYVSGETGIKTQFLFKGNIYLSAYGGVRAIYSFGKYGFTGGASIGILLGE